MSSVPISAPTTPHRATRPPRASSRLDPAADRRRDLANARRRRSYARRKADRAVFTIEEDFYPLADRLVETGFLEQWAMDDRSAANRAYKRRKRLDLVRITVDVPAFATPKPLALRPWRQWYSGARMVMHALVRACGMWRIGTLIH
jgi:hypothetical protein